MTKKYMSSYTVMNNDAMYSKTCTQYFSLGFEGVGYATCLILQRDFGVKNWWFTSIGLPLPLILVKLCLL